MIISKIIGGLGNAMFQYAFAKSLSVKYNVPLKIDLSLYKNYYKTQKCELEIFDLPDEISYKNNFSEYYHNNNLFKKILFNFINKKYFQSKHFLFENKLDYNPIKPVINFPFYLSGYWQSYKYFEKYEKSILELFKFPKLNEYNNEKLFEFMNNNNTTSVFCRRGDFVTNKKINKIHGFCTIEYYNNAIHFIKKNNPNSKFIFYSDEPKWLHKNFSDDSNNIIVDWNSEIPFRDMQLCSYSNNNISSNSAFSWWGSYLNKNKNKIVVVPKYWYNKPELNYVMNDLIPKDWVRI